MTTPRSRLLLVLGQAFAEHRHRDRPTDTDRAAAQAVLARLEELGLRWLLPSPPLLGAFEQHNRQHPSLHAVPD